MASTQPAKSHDPAGQLSESLRKLAAFEPTPFPVISLYLNAQPDEHGRDHFGSFTRKQLQRRSRMFPSGSEERESFDRDAEKIHGFLDHGVEASTNGLALFACSGENGFFEALQLNAPIARNEIYVQSKPNLFTLAWLDDRFARYAVVVLDSMSARLFLFGLGRVLEGERIDNRHVSRTQAGGWSQARYQRHAEDLTQKHMQEVVDALEHLVNQEQVEHLLLVGDEVAIPALQERLPGQLAGKVRDVLRLDMKSPEHEILKQSLEAMAREDAREDEERAERLLEGYGGQGLAAAGLHDVLTALVNGQVDELLINADAASIEQDEELEAGLIAALEAEIAPPGGESESGGDGDPAERIQSIAHAAVTKAKRTGARVHFLEDSALLKKVGGIGAFLRYRI